MRVIAGSLDVEVEKGSGSPLRTRAGGVLGGKQKPPIGCRESGVMVTGGNELASSLLGPFAIRGEPGILLLLSGGGRHDGHL